tara:strand:- start:80 stop:235 length:156 start_codon:yes stop_codon:yes gene_type:complete
MSSSLDITILNAALLMDGKLHEYVLEVAQRRKYLFEKVARKLRPLGSGRVN